MDIRLYETTLRTSHPSFPKREILLLRMNNQVGEIAPLPGWSQETFALAKKQIISLIPSLLDTPLDSLYPSVAFGIACARSLKKFPLSIKTQALYVPNLCHIDVSYSTYVKIKVGALSVEETLRCLDQLYRKNPKIHFRLDFNRKWSFAKVQDFLGQYSNTNLDYLEEPTYELDKLKEIPYQLALDETFREEEDIIDLPNLHTIIWKPMLQKPPHLKRNIPVTISSSYESDLGLCLLASYAQYTKRQVHGLGTYAFLNDTLLRHPLEWDGNCLYLPHKIAIKYETCQEIYVWKK